MSRLLSGVSRTRGVLHPLSAKGVGRPAALLLKYRGFQPRQILLAPRWLAVGVVVLLILVDPIMGQTKPANTIPTILQKAKAAIDAGDSEKATQLLALALRSGNYDLRSIPRRIGYLIENFDPTDPELLYPLCYVWHAGHPASKALNDDQRFVAAVQDCVFLEWRDGHPDPHHLLEWFDKHLRSALRPRVFSRSENVCVANDFAQWYSFCSQSPRTT